MGTPASVASMEWGACVVAEVPVTPELAREVKRLLGIVPTWLPLLARSPWVARGFAELAAHPVTYAPRSLCDLITLVVSQDNSCRYCYGAQRTIMKVLGYRDDDIARLERDFHVLDLSPAEQAALELARRISRADPRPTPADVEAVVAAGLDRNVVAEVAVMAAASTFCNRVATLVAFPPATEFEAMADRPVFRLMRPLIAWRMRARPRAPEAALQPSDGPCADVVAALGRSPAAAVLRRTIDAAWGSPVLPRRTKALLLAVVGRALGCATSRAEAVEALAQEGWTPQEVDDAVAHLASPRFDSREARLIPFARETVRYQVGPIQRRFRAVAEGMTSEEVLEAVGVLALANTVARLSVLTAAG